MAAIHASSWAFGPSADRWGHHAPRILIGAILTSVVLVLRPLPYDSPAAVVVPVLLVAVVLATWVKMRAHDRGLCERCLAAMPLNASESAQRYRRRLALAHLGSARRALVTYLLVLVALDLMLVLVPADRLELASYLWAGVQTTLIYLVLAHSTHRRLQPWCSRCGDGGGSSPADVPDPFPIDSRSR